MHAPGQGYVVFCFGNLGYIYQTKWVNRYCWQRESTVLGSGHVLDVLFVPRTYFLQISLVSIIWFGDSWIPQVVYGWTLHPSEAWSCVSEFPQFSQRDVSLPSLQPRNTLTALIFCFLLVSHLGMISFNLGSAALQHFIPLAVIPGEGRPGQRAWTDLLLVISL